MRLPNDEERLMLQRIREGTAHPDLTQRIVLENGRRYSPVFRNGEIDSEPIGYLRTKLIPNRRDLMKGKEYREIRGYLVSS